MAETNSNIIETRVFKAGLQPESDEDYYCIYHPDVKIVVIRGRIFKFTLSSDLANSHALDIDYICPVCGLKQTWGLPLTEEQYNGYGKHTIKE